MAANCSLSRRGSQHKDFSFSMCKAEYKWIENPYKERINPEGIINLGTSLNKLMFDVLNEKFKDPSNHQVHEEYTFYGDEKGFQSFREAIAGFLNHFMKPAKPILPGNLITLNGCGSICEALAMALADPGDGFLIPAPYYGGFIKDFMIRANVKIVSADVPSQSGSESDQPYKLTVDILEKAFNDATQKNIKIRALVLVNPNNPFGYIYSDEEIKGCLQFAHRQGIHVILDELYLLSIFKDGCTMNCVLSYEDIPDPERLHVVWGLSKDFCVSGFRCGVLHTTNQDVFDSIAQIAELQQVSPLVQHVFTNILSDIDWIDNVYTPTNHKRLRESCKIVCETLQKCNIPFVEAVAGFFIWADFRQFLKKPTHEDEWRIFEIFIDNKVYILPGIAFASQEPGWFRIIFANKPTLLKLAMDRFSEAVDACRKQVDN